MIYGFTQEQWDELCPADRREVKKLYIYLQARLKYGDALHKRKFWKGYLNI